MNTLRKSLESIINKCGMSNEMIEEKNEEENEYQQIKEMINEIHQLKNQRKYEKKKKNEIKVISLNIEIKSKIQQLYDYYNNLQLHFIQNNNSSSLFQLIQNEMKQFENEENKEKKKNNKIKRNKTFHIDGLEEYNMNEIPNDINDKRIDSIQQNDNQINEKLNIIEDNIKSIKILSQNINSQLDDQEIKLLSTDQKISNNMNTIDSQQLRFRNIILKLNTPHNCCVTFLLICCIFGLFSITASILYSHI